jgi:hypothetical protein
VLHLYEGPPAAAAVEQAALGHPSSTSNSRFSIIATWYSFVVATLVAGYAERTTEVVTTNSMTGIADPAPALQAGALA